jgi:D-3-phosphoglycerate dehydrogenase
MSLAGRRTILIGPTTFGAFDPRPVQQLEDAGFTVRRNPVGRKMNQEELLLALTDVVGVVAGLEMYPAEVLARSQLKVVSRCGVGLENIDLPAAQEMGIKVYSTPNAPTTAVAELTVGALITLLRGVPQMDRMMHDGKWEKRSGPQLEGKTITLIGLGRIGRKVAEYLRPFGVRLLGVDPVLQGAVEGIRMVSLAQALAESDIVSIHASGSAEILGEAELAAIKPGAYVANTGRGGLINERALCNALESGRVAGAWLDCFSEEPYQGPLTSYPQVLMTPHIGYSSDEARRRMEMEAASNLLAGLADS